jgi:hypothetical protein
MIDAARFTPPNPTPFIVVGLLAIAAALYLKYFA